MNKEEALIQLRIGPGINEDVSEEYNEAVDIAIKALEAQPSEDYISRKAVLDGLASIAKAKAKSDSQKSLMGRVMFFYRAFTISYTTAKSRRCKRRHSITAECP